MAKQRYINTKIWEDAWFNDLDPIEKLFFVYLLTNPMTNIVGIYELSKGTIGRATGLESRVVEEILLRFEKAEKVFYRNGWVIIKNFIKHQNNKSPKIQIGIKAEMENISSNIKDFIEKGYGIDTISHSNTNSNTNTNTNTNINKSIAETSSAEISEIIKVFETINPACKRMYGNKTQRKACQDLIDVYSFEKVINTIEKVLPKTKGMKFFPTITTPLQLCEKWSSLESAIARYQQDANKIKFI